jgi:hypothetical protein
MTVSERLGKRAASGERYPVQVTPRTVAVETSRGLAATGVLLSAVVHLDLWDLQGFRHIPTIGPLFMLNFIGGVVIGVVMLIWRHWLPMLAAAGFGAATVAAFWISVVHGLFGLKEVATGSSQVLAEVAEYAAVVFGLFAAALLWNEARRQNR